MKKILFGAAAIALMSTPALAAPSQTQTVTINGTAPNVCTLAAPTGSATGGVTVNASNINVTGLFNTSDATMAGGTASLRFAGMCNYVHFISLKSANGALFNTTTQAAPLGGAFVRRVGYQAGYSWASQSVAAAIPNDTSTTTAGTAGASVTSANKQINGANAGDLDVTLTFTASGSTPVVAGDYADTLTVQIGADL